MSCLVGLLQAAGSDLEPRLKGQMGGFAGGIVRMYLPQTWVFRTEEEVATLGVDRTGSFRAIAGAGEKPDVTIETTHARLSAALRTRQRDKVPPGPFKATPHTEKGRTAFEFLRGRLGL
ncbi:MAG: hypothetical protein L3J96_01410 [Thermoplasmata archaeon]|nr:hypothetical protein [Thermoplasmata archaeon]